MEVLPPSEEDLEALASAATMMPGAEYVAPAALSALWRGDRTGLRGRAGRVGATLQTFLKWLHPAWHVVGRVDFHLTENRKDEETPFAFRPA